MDQLITALSTQVPDLVVLLVIVFAFLKYLQKRDDTYLQLVREINEALKSMTEELKTHSIATADAISEMRRTVNRRNNGTQYNRPSRR